MLKLAELTITIDKPVSDIYAYMINHENYIHWYPEVISVTPANGLPTGTPGKRYQEKLRISKKRQTGFIVEVKEAEINKSYAFEADWKPLQTRMEVYFKALSEAQTQVSLCFFSRNKSVLVFLLANLLVKRLIRKQTIEGLNRLKDILEA